VWYGDGKMKGSGEKEDEGYMANRQNHIRATIQGFRAQAKKSTKKLVSGRRDGNVEHRPMEYTR